MCTHNKGGLQSKDVVVTTASKALWKKLGKIIERLGILVKLNQAPALGPKHDKIRAQWASRILSKNMLKKV